MLNMCGGYKATIKDISKEELCKLYSPEQLKYLEEKGFIESYFWEKRPILPAIYSGQTRLFDWGNRDKKAPFPLTGWAKKESIESGKWKYLHPQEIKIPIIKGYERQIWFDMPEGTKGLLVEKEGDKRIYMITEKANEDYFKKTGHPRMPVGKKCNFKKE